MKEMTRKEFLKLTGASTALLAMSQLMSGGGVILIGTQLIPLLSGLFG